MSAGNEYGMAAAGKVADLRLWLQQHPERVNVPSPGSTHTLLFNAVDGLARVNLSALAQGRPNRHDETIRMLCEEFGADPDTPNGGLGNTAVHQAVVIGDARTLYYLVHTRSAAMTKNNLGETPLVLCARLKPQSDCESILQQEVNQREMARADEAVGLTLRQRLEALRVRDSDSEDEAEEGNLKKQMPTGGVKPSSLPNFNHSGSSGISYHRSNSKNALNGHDISSGSGCSAAPTAANNTSSSGGGGTDLPRPPGPLTAAPAHQQIPSDLCCSPPPGLTFTSSWSSSDYPATQHNTTNNLNNAINGNHNYNACGSPTMLQQPLSTNLSYLSSALPQPRTVQLRKEEDISGHRTFGNKELEEFRHEFGNGFTYLQCSDHYEVRGLLPYNFKGSEYYTPVILSMYQPHSPSSPATPLNNNNNINNNSITTRSSGSAHAPVVGYCRYRAVLDRERMNDFGVSRKAEYIDPLSGAVIPTTVDSTLCTSLVQFVRYCVIDNFERAAPMTTNSSTTAFVSRPSLAVLGTPGDLFHHHHGSTSPAYMSNVLGGRDPQRVWAYRVLQELSHFGDGLFTLNVRSRTAHGYIPIVKETNSEQEVLVLASASPMTGNDRNSFPTGTAAAAAAASLSGAAAATTTKTKPIETEILFAVRTVIQFPVASNESNSVSPAGYPHPPQFFLTDCCDATQASSSSSSATAAGMPPPHLRPQPYSGSPTYNTEMERAAARTNFLCFGPLLENTATGLVKEVLEPHLSEWHRQQQQTNCKGGAKGKAAAATATPSVADLQQQQQQDQQLGSLFGMLTTLQKALAKAFTDFAARHRANGSAAAAQSCTSPLDTFFTSTGTSHSGGTGARGTDSAHNTTNSSNGGNTRSTSGGPCCLLCCQPQSAKMAVLQPCRHGGCCLSCATRLQNHCRGGVFHCPVCRSNVEEVQEVYLCEKGKQLS